MTCAGMSVQVMVLDSAEDGTSAVPDANDRNRLSCTRRIRCHHRRHGRPASSAETRRATRDRRPTRCFPSLALSCLGSRLEQ